MKMKKLLTEWRNAISEGIMKNVDGTLAQGPYAVLDYYTSGNAMYDQTVPVELQDISPDIVHTVGNCVMQCKEGVPLEEAIEANSTDFGHTDDITFLAMTPEEVEEVYAFCQSGGFIPPKFIG